MDNLSAIIAEPISKILIVAGLVFLGLAIVGKFSGKFELGPVARVFGAILGLVFVGMGLGMASAAAGEEEPGRSPPVDVVPTIPIELLTVSPTNPPIPTTAPTAAPTAVPTPIPSPTPAVIPMPLSRERIQFDRGSASDSFVVNLPVGESKGYVLRIMAGQQMHITIPNPVRLLVLDTQNNAMATELVGDGHWVVNIPYTGDYTVVLYGEGQTYVTIYIPPLP